MNKILLLAFMVFLLSGCGSPESECAWSTLPVQVAAVTDYDYQAIAGLNEAFGRNLFIASPHGIEIEKVDPEELFGSDSEETHEEGKAITTCKAGVIDYAHILIVSYRYDTPESRNILAHELFHSLGFSHHTLEAGLMNAEYPQDINSPISTFITQDLRDWIDDCYPEGSAAMP